MLRNIQAWIVLLLVGFAALPAPVWAAPAWRICLPDTVEVSGRVVLLRDVSTVPVPAAAGKVVVYAGGQPNTVVSVSRQIILRKLVSAGLSAGVSLQGATTCQIVFAGHELNSDAVTNEIRRVLQKLVPASVPGAPDSWFEVEIPNLRLAVTGDWSVRLKRHNRLAAGRNLVPVLILADDRTEAVSVSVILHRFNETARAFRTIGKDTPLSEAQFNWEWQDMAHLPNGVAAGRIGLSGASSTRSITAGDLLRESDMKETPLILAGDAVELMVIRGQVAVTVRAFARQPGCLGQTIPVRNELTGRLVNARVAGPGLVEWRR